MIVVDVNLLLYAVNRDAPDHRSAKAWWESVAGGDEPVGLAWLVLLGFLRISTSARILPRPLSPEQALAVVDGWMGLPAARVVEATEHHWTVFKRLIEPLGTAGNLASDVHLAALAIEHGATLYSTDRDFARFDKLQWRNPLAP